MAIALLVLLSLVIADTARGGTYRVAQCGWGVGAEIDPVINAFGRGFALGPQPCAPGSGLQALRLEAAAAPEAGGGFARARWVPPAGTFVVGARATWAGDLQPGLGQFIGVDVGTELRPLASASGLTPLSQVAPPVPAEAWALEFQMACVVASCSRSTPSSALLRELTINVLDPTPPSVLLGGTILTPGWLQGTAQLALAAEDTGAGIFVAEATVDGAQLLAAPQSCEAASIEGELRATRLRPCPPTAKPAFEVDTTRIADGSHTLGGCAVDFGGERGCAPGVAIEVDNSAPSIAFTAAREGQVAVKLSDPYSGPASGSISMQRAGESGWTDLATRFEAGADGSAKLTADLPEIGDGSYAFRAVASDAVGNAGSAQLSVKGAAAKVLRQVAAGKDGRPGRAPRPHRGGRAEDDARVTHLTAGLRLAPAKGSREKGAGARAELKAPFGTAVELRGRLTDVGGDGLAARTIGVLTSAARGAKPRRTLRRAATDSDGRFDLLLPAGPSRRVVASFHGGEGLAPSRSRPLALRVGAAVSLAVEPRRLATGETVLLRGRVRPGSARIPRRGKVVTIQYLERASGEWRPALVVRTDGRGRFRARYRFRYVTGEARIRLRATALPEAGWPYAEGSSPPLPVTVNG